MTRASFGGAKYLVRACVALVLVSHGAAWADMTPESALKRDERRAEEEASAFVQLTPPTPEVAARRRTEAIEQRDPGPEISYLVVEQTLQALADSLSKLTGLAFVAEGDTRLLVRNIRLQGPLHEALEALSNGAGVVWYSNGLRYTLSHAGSTGNVFRTIPFGDLPEGQVMQRINDAYPARSKVIVQLNSSTRSVLVRGPRSVADDIERAVRNNRNQNPSGLSIVRYGVVGK